MDEYSWRKIDEIMTKSIKIINIFPYSFQIVNLPILMSNNLYQPVEIDHDQTLAAGIFALIFKTKWLLQRYFHKDTSNQIYSLIIHLIPLFFSFFNSIYIIPMKISHTKIGLISKLFQLPLPSIY